ncbi:MAG: hypothetical protein UR65_C0012G0017 [Candidatus Moranbacteria bacterium GW2011_GWE2_35_164]|nr:MAG: hypothetical protein UR65_C0012G0017 [Candidatus Moranbacteria bacterium GW2011_GWE2_35_164]
MFLIVWIKIDRQRSWLRGGKTMNNIAIVKGDGEWGVLFNANNQPFCWGEIIGHKDDMVIFENRGQYPRRLVFECESALSAQEAFDAMIKNDE